MKKIILTALSLLAMVPFTRAQTFTALLTGNPVDVTGWTIGGNATAVTDHIQLTAATTGQVGYAYYNTPVNLSSCSEFSVSYDFQVSNSSAPTADGIAFWYITTPPTGFVLGGGIGIPPNSTGLQLIVDTYDNNSTPLENPLVTLRGFTNQSYVEGSPVGLLGSQVLGQTQLIDGNWHTITLTYNGGALAVSLDGTPNVITANYTLSQTGYFGLSASTGALYSQQSVRNVNISAALTAQAPTVTSPLSYCQGQVVPALTATGNSLLWYTDPNAAAGTGSTTAPTPSTTTPGTYTFYVTQTSGTCESVKTPIEVDVTAPPAGPTVTSPQFYCPGNTPIPLTANGTGLEWYTVPTGGTPNPIAPVPATTTAGSTTYYVTQTVGPGCVSVRTPLTITVNPTPAAPTVSSAIPAYCQGAFAAPLTATGQNLLWYMVPTGGIGAATPIVPPTTTPGTATYYVTQSINGCESPEAQVQVTTYPLPAAPDVADVTYCLDAVAVPLTATGNSLTWYTQPVGGIGTSVAPLPITTTPGTTLYYVSQTSANGCEGPRAIITVIVNQGVTAGIAVDKASICSTDVAIVQFTGSGPANTQYAWTFDGGTAVGNGPGPYTVSWTTAGNKTITVTASIPGCDRTRSDTIMVHVALPPLVDFILQPDACVGDQVNIQPADNSLNEDIYNWDFDGADVAFGGTGPGVQMVSWQQAGVKSVTLVAIVGACRSEPVVKTIDVHALPTPGIIGGVPAAAVCTGDTLRLIAAYDSNYTYKWTPGTFILAAHDTMAIASMRGNGTISVQVTDQFGCKASDSVSITTMPCCTVIMPTAFTPNGDGRNDTYGILTNGFFADQSSIRIADRWGRIVFNSANINARWDGIYKGEPQDIGTYYYYVTFYCNGKKTEQHGDFILTR